MLEEYAAGEVPGVGDVERAEPPGVCGRAGLCPNRSRPEPTLDRTESAWACVIVPALTALSSTPFAALFIAAFTALSLTFYCVSRSLSDLPDRRALCKSAVLMCIDEATAVRRAVERTL